MPADPLILDASAAAAILFAEPAGRILDRHLTDRVLTGPTLLPYELASVALKKMGRRPEHEEGLASSLAMLDDMAVNLVAVPPGRVLDTARRYRVGAYDAAYLWLAFDLGCTLVTLDRTLTSKARTAGIQVLDERG